VPYVHYDEMVNCVKGMPTVTPQEPRKGHWMINKEKNLAKCSNCKFFLNDKDEIKLLGTFIQGYNYCPYCGADMREVEE
jgi:Zn finger protein HypA/HybF involved in hydrogenase expression